MRVIVATMLCLAALATMPRAFAQAADPPAVCTSSATIWSAVSGGSDVAAMRAVRGQTPAACQRLLARIDARIAVLTTPRPQASAPVDPCGRARADWATLQDSTDTSAIQAFIATTPSQCAVQVSQAQSQLAVAQRASISARYVSHWQMSEGRCSYWIEMDEHTLTLYHNDTDDHDRPIVTYTRYDIAEVQADGTLRMSGETYYEPGQAPFPHHHEELYIHADAGGEYMLANVARWPAPASEGNVFRRCG